MTFSDWFVTWKPIIGMLHLPPLPGSPAEDMGLDEIREWVLREAMVLADGGVSGFIIENFGDAPFFPNRVPPHTVAFMTALAVEVKRNYKLPLGVNVLRNDGLSALAVATASEAEFIRVNVYTGARLTDQGIIQGEAHEIQRYRQRLSSSVAVFADVAVKHSAPLGPRSLEDEIADTVERGRADAVIASGSATGKQTPVNELRTAKLAAGSTPVLVGSGVSPDRVAEVLEYADGLIVGTAFKQNGKTTNPVSADAVAAFMAAVRKTRTR